jgi:hypothetical protein
LTSPFSIERLSLSETGQLQSFQGCFEAAPTLIVGTNHRAIIERGSNRSPSIAQEI